MQRLFVRGAFRQRPLPGLAPQVTLGDQETEVLGREERVALGHVGEKAHQRRGRRLGRQHVRRQPVDVLLGQTRQHDPVLRHADQRLERRDHLLAAVRPDHDHRVALGQRAAEQGQERQRQLVGPLEIVDDQDQRTFLEEPTDDAHQAIEEPFARGRTRQVGLDAGGADRHESGASAAS